MHFKLQIHTLSEVYLVWWFSVLFIRPNLRQLNYGRTEVFKLGHLCGWDLRYPSASGSLLVYCWAMVSLHSEVLVWAAVGRNQHDVEEMACLIVFSLSANLSNCPKSDLLMLDIFKICIGRPGSPAFRGEYMIPVVCYIVMTYITQRILLLQWGPSLMIYRNIQGSIEHSPSSWSCCLQIIERLMLCRKPSLGLEWKQERSFCLFLNKVLHFLTRYLICKSRSLSQIYA